MEIKPLENNSTTVGEWLINVLKIDEILFKTLANDKNFRRVKWKKIRITKSYLAYDYNYT